MRFRRDTNDTNEHGQVRYWSHWLGGPTLSRVTRVRCQDGVLRTADVTSHPDTSFSVPAKVRVAGKHVTGFLFIDDDSRWRFTANRSGKNARLVNGAAQ